jgi:hypothetical protein
MNPWVIAGGVLASLWLRGLLTRAVESRLPVVNRDALTVLAHLDNAGPDSHGRGCRGREAEMSLTVVV